MAAKTTPAAMKVLIGYDGSECARAAIVDLRHAGLPQHGEAVVMSIADLASETPLTAYGISGDGVAPAVTTAVLEAMRTATEKALAEARMTAGEGKDLLSGVLPEWTIRAEAVADSPYWALVSRAREWSADLLVVGSHGRSALGRLAFGSVSQNALSHAPCSVRIGRSRPAAAAGEVTSKGGPLPSRILLAIDDSPDSALAAEAVYSRNWPAGTEVLVVSVVDPRWSAILYGFGDWLEQGTSTRAPIAVHRRVDAIARELQGLGLTALPLVLDGTPKSMLVHEAEARGVDCIFLGARGHSRLQRFLIGSVSAAVAARAHCTVEVVRQGA